MQRNKLRFLFKILVLELVSMNTNAATIMIGEAGADSIKKEYQLAPGNEILILYSINNRY